MKQAFLRYCLKVLFLALPVLLLLNCGTEKTKDFNHNTSKTDSTMITVKTFVFNDFQENTYVLYDDSNECIVVDCGCLYPEENFKLQRYLDDNKLKPVKLISTHCHIDHIMGNKAFKAKYNVEYLAHREDSFLIESGVSHASAFGFTVEQPPMPDGFLAHGDTLKFGNSELTILNIPGHSPGSIALYHKPQQFVIVGDVLFAGSIGRTDLPGGNMDTLLDGIKTHLFSLPEETLVYCGHGPTTTIGEEKRSNPFFAR